MSDQHRGHGGGRARRVVVVAGLFVAAFAMLALAPAGALAADVREGWGQWWLPPDRSTHGHMIDTLFHWIFWITMVTFVGVQGLLIVFLIKYRHRPDKKKAVFTHGNTRLEMAWTLAPALILAILALGSKRAWDHYRYSPGFQDENRAKVLVIGERFKWNVIYPGPDGEFGRYMVFPKPTDLKWPDGQKFAGVDGPAFLPYEDAIQAIGRYNNRSPDHALGKDMDDPKGKDDIWQGALARTMEIPVDRPVEVQLSSKDVIHSFYLPNFRVKLDAVPGMRGRTIFTATMTSKQMEETSRRRYPIDELLEAVKRPENRDLTAAIPENTPQAEYYKPPRARTGYWRYAGADKRTIVRDAGAITPDVAQQLKDAGITEVTAYKPGVWDLVCEELCGEGHSKMQGQVVVLSQEEYDAKKWDKPAGGVQPPTTAPAIAMTEAN